MEKQSHKQKRKNKTSKTEENYKVINKLQTTLEKNDPKSKWGEGRIEERKRMKPEGGECDRRQNRQSTPRESVVPEM